MLVGQDLHQVRNVVEVRVVPDHGVGDPIGGHAAGQQLIQNPRRQEVCALWTQNTDPSRGLPILWRWGTRWTDKLFCLRLLWLYLLALVYAHLYAYRILYHFILWLVLFLAFTFTFIGHLWDLFLYFCVLFFIFDSKILTYFLVELLYQTNMKFNVFNLGRI